MTLTVLLAFIAIMVISGAAFGAGVRRVYERGGPSQVKLLLIQGTVAAAGVLLPYYLFVYSGHVSPWRYWVGPWLITITVGLLPVAITIAVATLTLLPSQSSPATSDLAIAPGVLLAVVPVALGFFGSIFVRGAFWFTVPIEVAIAGLWGVTVFAVGLVRTGGRQPDAPTAGV
jgi:hypothetical protein